MADRGSMLHASGKRSDVQKATASTSATTDTTHADMVGADARADDDLAERAGRLRARLGETPLVARYAGDDFDRGVTNE